MPNVLPEELERAVVDAGFATLKKWAEAAGVSYNGLCTLRSLERRKVPAGMVERLIAVSRVPFTPAELHALLKIRRAPR